MPKQLLSILETGEYLDKDFNEVTEENSEVKIDGTDETHVLNQ